MCLDLENEVVEIDYNYLQIGDHLVVERGVYTHHGIYTGGGNVIHYAGFRDGKKTGPIEEVSIYDFTAGKLYAVREYQSEKNIYSREEVVKRAKSRLGENNYNLLHNNCEHFAEWCWIDESIAHQVLDGFFNLAAIIPYPVGSPESITDVLMPAAAQKISNVLSNTSMVNNPNLRKPYFYIKPITDTKAT